MPNDRTSLLTQAKSTLLQQILFSVERCTPIMAETALKNADLARRPMEQETQLAVYTTLSKQPALLWRTLHNNLDQLLSRALQTAYDSHRPQFSMGSGAKLSLIDTTTIESELLVGSLANRFRNQSAEELRNLNIRMALLFNNDNVNERENPFRPWLIARALPNTAETIGLRSHVVPQMSQYLADCIDDNIESTYRDLNHYFSEHGIAAELNLHVQKTATQHKKAIEASEQTNQATPERSANMAPPGRAQSGANVLSSAGMAPPPNLPASATAHGGVAVTNDQVLDAWLAAIRHQPVKVTNPHQTNATRNNLAQPDSISPQNPASTNHWLSSGIQKIGSALRQFLGAPDTAAYQGYSAQQSSRPFHTVSLSLSQAVNYLNEVIPTEDHLLEASGNIRNLILEQRQELAKKTEDHDENMTIDIVAMLFEFILRDENVPPEIRVQLARLQFLILKIALHDPNLLTQRGHPVRLLVNRIATIATAHKAIDSSHELITAKIRQLIETLLHDTSDKPELFVPLFTRLLDEFDKFIAAELRHKDQLTDQAIAALSQINPDRTQHFQRITNQIKLGLASQPLLDTKLREFFEKTWSQIIEFGESISPEHAKRFRQLIPDLIWSVTPKHSDTERKQLTNMLPSLINRLREGAQLIAWPENQQKELLDWLFIMHTRAMYPFGNSPAPSESPSIINAEFKSLIQDLPVTQTLSEREQQMSETILLDTATRQVSHSIQTLSDETAESLTSDSAASMAGSMSGSMSGSMEELEIEMDLRLHHGVMIELKLSSTPSSARLSWINRTANKLLLSLDEAKPPVIMSLRAFKRMLIGGRVRFLENQPLFERALQSLLTSAEQLEQTNSFAPV